jgi:hypothetical protein
MIDAPKHVAVSPEDVSRVLFGSRGDSANGSKAGAERVMARCGDLS